MLRPPVEPMLAAPVDRLPRSGSCRGGCAYEPKFDGYRALVFVAGGGVVIQSRRGSDITAAFPEVAAAVADQLPGGTVLDGELVILGRGGVLEFTALQRRLGAGRRAAQRLAGEQPGSLVTFDLLAVDGQDRRGLAFSERRHRLEALMDRCVPPLQLVPQTLDEAVAQRWVDQYAAATVGLEGVVIKGLTQPYQSGRRGWQKYRVRNTHEVIVGAVTGTLVRPGRLVLGLFDYTGELIVVGATGELRHEQAAMLRPFLAGATSPHPWPDELPAGRMGQFGGGKLAVTLVEPLVVEVSADQSFEHTKWRHIVRFIRPRPDLGVDEVAPASAIRG